MNKRKTKALTFESLKKAALRLPPSSRARLARTLIDSLSGPAGERLEALWTQLMQGHSARTLPLNYTAVIKKQGAWWIGWIEEIPGINCQERTREALLGTLELSLNEALEIGHGHGQDANARDLEAEVLESVRDAKAGRWARKTEFIPRKDGSFLRRITRSDGTVEKEHIVNIDAPATATAKQKAARTGRSASSRDLAYQAAVRADVEAGLANSKANRVTPAEEVLRESERDFAKGRYRTFSKGKKAMKWLKAKPANRTKK